MKVTRTDAKSFPTHYWDSSSGSWKSGWPKTVIPYRLPELIAAPATEPIWICEGEKDANNVAALGLVATTNPGGAAKWQPELAQWFKDKQLVYVLEDNDDAGRMHTAKIMSALRGIVPIIAVNFQRRATFPIGWRPAVTSSSCSRAPRRQRNAVRHATTQSSISPP